MASRIQGITVEIGGDTTKLSTALSKVNREIRDTQGQLKDVNKLLKLDLGNTELMAQKHRLLAQAVGETKEKLEALKLAGQQANDALARGEISQSQYDAQMCIRDRVDSGDEDALIAGLIETGERMCADIARMEAGELEGYLSIARPAILYAAAYLYEHREEADHEELRCV